MELATLPAALTQLMASLETSLHVTIEDEAREGACYDAGAFEYAPPVALIYLPLILRDHTLAVNVSDY